jgi:hypothetical protein
VSVTSGSSYFSVTPTSGSSTGSSDHKTHTVTVNRNNISPGQTVSGQITISSGNADDSPQYIELSAGGCCDFTGDGIVDFTDFAILASSWQLSCESDNLVNNGSFDTDISGWTLYDDPLLSKGTVSVVYDDANGLPVGSAFIKAETGTSGADYHFFYQVIPVTIGRQYKISGNWKGSIAGTVPDPPTARNWAELWVGFVSTGPDTIPANWGSIMYKKAYGNGNLNTSTGVWDWESILASPNNDPNSPPEGIFTATDNYMVIFFHVGGRANSGSPWINADNVKVMEVGAPITYWPIGDLNGDCFVDFNDLDTFTLNWLAYTP